ncbi:MAG: CynX/NimT family MFS transporter [Pseudomonadota bacterium]
MTNPWVMLAILFFARTSTGYSFQSIGSAGPVIAASLGIDFALVGTLIGLFMLPGMVLALPSGLLARHASDRMLIGLGLLLMTLGILVSAMGGDYTAVAAGRLLTGIGATVTNLYFAKATLEWFAESRHLPLAMAILLNSWPLGIALGLMTQGDLTLVLGWRGALSISGVATLAAALLMALAYREAPGRAVPPAGGVAALRALAPREWRDMVLVGLVWGALNVGLVLVFGFAPALLASEGVDLGRAGWLVGLGTWIGILAIPLGGAIASRTGHSRAVIAVCTFASMPVFVLLAARPDLPFAYVAFGLVAFAAAGPIMALPQRFVGAANRAAGMGLLYTIYYVTITVAPAFAGWLHDGYGPAAPIAFGALVMLLSLACQAGLSARPMVSNAARP